MAVRVHLSQLNSTQIEIIRQQLHFRPEVPYLQKTLYSSNPPPVPFYQVTQDGFIYIPYTFAYSILPKSSIQRHPTYTFAFTGYLFDHQIPVEDEAYYQLQKTGTTTLGLHTGFGKTVVAAKLAAKLQGLTLVLYNREILGTQWNETFQEFTNAIVWTVGEGSPPLMNVPSNGRIFQIPNFQVILCLDRRIGQVPREIRELVRILVIDEGHLFCTQGHVECLLATQPEYIITATATLERDDKMHRMIYAMCGTHGIFRISDKPFTVYKVITGIAPTIQLNVKGSPDWSVIKRSLCENQWRNRMICTLASSYPEGKILILTSLVDHAYFIAGCLKTYYGQTVDVMAGSKKSYHDAHILVGTSSKIGTGFDQRTACPDFDGIKFNVMIICCSIKKASLLEQNVGRIRAENGIYIHLVDHHTIHYRHFDENSKWYVSRRGTITEVVWQHTQLNIVTR